MGGQEEWKMREYDSFEKAQRAAAFQVSATGSIIVKRGDKFAVVGPSEMANDDIDLVYTAFRRDKR